MAFPGPIGSAGVLVGAVSEFEGRLQGRRPPGFHRNRTILLQFRTGNGEALVQAPV